LLSILFTDIVDSTVVVSRVGDVAWRELLARYNHEARIALERQRVRSIEDTGDGVLALFDSPGRAVAAAVELTDLARTHGLELRAGVHTGEVQLGKDEVRGVAVHEGARVMGAAGAYQVVVSAATRSLLATNSALRFESLGNHQLKGIDGERELFQLVRS
jgi:class 3 adenylate cyclase